ncbi:MAG: FAD-dependent oxidoreductase [Snowella sp.]|nr:FAD-dependent oxidoreductase [Snowella sp.]
MNKNIIVIGGGVAGMSACAKLIDLGFEVTLIEKDDSLGGHVKNWYKVFPDFTDASEILDKLKEDMVGTQVLTNITVTAINGITPHFQVSLSNGNNIEAAAILMSTGFRHFDAAIKEEYGYGVYDNCITAVELDLRLKQQSLTTVQGKIPKKIAMIHCVGSRDQKVGNYYCSRVCCTNTIKDAIEIKQLIPDCDIYCLYMDIRVFGRGYEELYRTAQETYGIQFIRGRLSEAGEKNDGNGSLLLRLEDTLIAKPMRLTVDMLVLMVGMEGNTDLAQVAGLEVGCDRFYTTAHQQYSNNTSAQPGIFLAGTATGPKAIMESITDGRSAAAEIAAFLASSQSFTNYNGQSENSRTVAVLAR